MDEAQHRLALPQGTRIGDFEFHRVFVIAEMLKTCSSLGPTQYIVTAHSPILPDLLADDSPFSVRRSDRQTHIDSFITWGPLARHGGIDRASLTKRKGFPFPSAF